jgi:hypothetical protein
MGQQPNMPLEIEDLPRRKAAPGAARRWSPDRPGDLAGPSDVPSGGAFGRPGPDAGYALRLLRDRELPTATGEARHDLEVAIAALMTARASWFGRAPMVEDAEVAEALLGVGDAGASWRTAWTAGLAHKPHRTTHLVDAVDWEALLATPDEVRARIKAGDTLVGQRATGNG